MALGIAEIIYIVLAIVALSLQVLLYIIKNESKNNIFTVNMLFAILLSYMAFTSFPSNFSGQRILAVSLAIIAVLALVLKSRYEKFVLTSKVMLSASIFGNFFLLFL